MAVSWYHSLELALMYTIYIIQHTDTGGFSPRFLDGVQEETVFVKTTVFNAFQTIPYGV